LQHAAQPVEGRVRIAGPNGLVQGGNQVKVLLSALVIQENFALDGVFDRLSRELALFGSGDSGFERIVSGAGVAIGEERDLFEEVVGSGNAAITEPTLRIGQGAAQESHDLSRFEGAEGVYTGPGKEGSDYFERRILGGSADEDDVASFDIW